jgi:hypothetical protein
MASVLAKKVATMAGEKIAGQLVPMVIDRVEPMVESRVRSSLRTMKQKYPSQVRPFLITWDRLNKAVHEELGVSGGKRHRRKTRRRRNAVQSI